MYNVVLCGSPVKSFKTFDRNSYEIIISSSSTDKLSVRNYSYFGTVSFVDLKLSLDTSEAFISERIMFEDIFIAPPQS